MATSTKREQAEHEEQPQERELHYRCGGHLRWFPDEDPVLLWSEFSVDPVTLERRRTYCRRCDARQKQQYVGTKKRNQALPAKVRVGKVRERQEARLETLIRSGHGDDDEAWEIRWHLNRLTDEVKASVEDAADAAAEETQP